MMMFRNTGNSSDFQKTAQANNKENVKAQNQRAFVGEPLVTRLLCYQNITLSCIFHKIVNIDGHIYARTNLFIAAFNNTSMTVLYEYITL